MYLQLYLHTICCISSNFSFQGPSFPEPLVSPEDMDKLDWKCDVNKSLSYVYEAITLTRMKIDGQCPLFGFTGAPVSSIAINLMNLYQSSCELELNRIPVH